MRPCVCETRKGRSRPNHTAAARLHEVTSSIATTSTLLSSLHAAATTGLLSWGSNTAHRGQAHRIRPGQTDRADKDPLLRVDQDLINTLWLLCHEHYRRESIWLRAEPGRTLLRLPKSLSWSFAEPVYPCHQAPRPAWPRPLWPLLLQHMATGPIWMAVLHFWLCEVPIYGIEKLLGLLVGPVRIHDQREQGQPDEEQS